MSSPLCSHRSSPPRISTPLPRARSPRPRLLRTQTEPRNRLRLRTRKSPPRVRASFAFDWGATLREDPPPPLPPPAPLLPPDGSSQPLVAALAAHSERLALLLRPWDACLRGCVTRQHLRRVARELLPSEPTSRVDQLFKTFDPMSRGYFEFSLLHAAISYAKAHPPPPSSPTPKLSAHSLPFASPVERIPLLSRKSIVYTFGPAVPQMSHMCKKLVESFDGKIVTAAFLAERELKLNSPRAEELRRARSEGSGAPGSLPMNLILAMLRGLVETGKGPFFLRGIPRSLEELQAMERRELECRCALEIVVSSMGPQPGSGEMVQQMAERDMLVTIQGTSDLASALSQVEGHLSVLRQRDYDRKCEERAQAEAKEERERRERRERLELDSLQMASNRAKAQREGARQLAIQQKKQKEWYHQSLENRLSKLQDALAFDEMTRSSLYESLVQSRSSSRLGYRLGEFGLASQRGSRSMPRLNCSEAALSFPCNQAELLEGEKLPSIPQPSRKQT